MRYYISLIFLLLQSAVFAHSGGTDSDGGHHDRVNGGYHYHHGEPAHSHQNGCSYKKKSINESQSKSYNDSIFRVPKLVYWTSFIIMFFIGLIDTVFKLVFDLKNLTLNSDKSKNHRFFEQFIYFTISLINWLLIGYYFAPREELILSIIYFFGSLFISIIPMFLGMILIGWIILPIYELIKKY